MIGPPIVELDVDDVLAVRRPRRKHFVEGIGRQARDRAAWDRDSVDVEAPELVASHGDPVAVGRPRVGIDPRAQLRELHLAAVLQRPEVHLGRPGPRRDVRHPLAVR